MGYLRLFFLTTATVLISSWWLEQVDNSYCRYGTEDSNRKGGTPSERLILMELMKRIPSRKIGREQRIPYIIFQTH